MKIIKRNGQEVPYDCEKIKTAIEAANSEVDDKISDTLIGFIVGRVEKRCAALARAVHVEEIQDMVINELDKSEAYKLARHYSEYRLLHEQKRIHLRNGVPIMTKQNVRCDACGCAFIPQPKTQREGEIEYSFFNCDYCGKAFMVSVTDAALRKDIRRYAALAERQKEKPLSEQALREITALKETNLKRAAELRQMYLK